jgi:anti-anti-sigma factor
MYEPFEIVRDDKAGPLPVLHLKGRLEAEGAQRLRQLCQSIRQEGHGELVVGLKDVSFVSSSGLGAFLLLTEEFREGGGQIVFAAPSQILMDAVNLLNLGEFLQIAPSLESALARTLAS